MSSTIEARVKRIVAQELGVAEVDFQTDANFIDDLGADSMQLVGLISAFEDEFGMDISDTDAERITTVQQAMDYATVQQQR